MWGKIKQRIWGAIASVKIKLTLFLLIKFIEPDSFPFLFIFFINGTLENEPVLKITHDKGLPLSSLSSHAFVSNANN